MDQRWINLLVLTQKWYYRAQASDGFEQWKEIESEYFAYRNSDLSPIFTVVVFTSENLKFLTI